MSSSNVSTAKQPTAFYSPLIFKNSLLKLSLGVTCVLSLSACQPSPTDDTANNNDNKAQDSSYLQNITPERAQTIEALAGVPMQQLASFDAQEIKQGGDTGISITTSESYSKPSSNITASRKGSFFIGNAFFRQPWVVAPASTDSRDGLGALFNVAACQSCHIKDGRGHA
ncbi:MAG TPA: thiol oxidoreductase, partial [Psychrobacter sp.]|nr:thiol oxidoreductase [Psychrobacter sp.]